MKKRNFAVLFTAMIITIVTAVSFLTGCSDSESSVMSKTEFTVGFDAEFPPYGYKDDNGEWVGFDADMAKAFAESIGVEAEFVEIDWDNKELELDGKSIDCVWNGMTLTDEVTNSMECTNAYCNNAQVVVVPAE